jgi:hypothetical protein
MVAVAMESTSLLLQRTWGGAGYDERFFKLQEMRIAMGNEVKCRVRFGQQESEGKVLLETSEIIFRGDFRLKIPFITMKSVKVVDDGLQVRTAKGLAIFDVGPGTAEKWREKILHPKSRIEKLGVQAGSKVTLMGFGKMDAEFLKEIEKATGATGAAPKTMKGEVRDGQWIFLKAEMIKDLAQISKIAKGMQGAAGLWVVYPKGNAKGSQKITEGEVLSAGRVAGLKDVKVVGFSPTHTALKFVIPVARR